VELYIRPRTNESDDRRTGTLVTGPIRLTLVRAGETNDEPLWTRTLPDAEAVTLFIDEMPSGRTRNAPSSKGKKGARAPHDVSSPERVVGPVPKLSGFTRRQLEGRPGLARTRVKGAPDAEPDQEQPEGGQKPARARRKAATARKRTTTRKRG
jgi:hypothetical protein